MAACCRFVWEPLWSDDVPDRELASRSTSAQHQVKLQAEPILRGEACQLQLVVGRPHHSITKDRLCHPVEGSMIVERSAAKRKMRPAS